MVPFQPEKQFNCWQSRVISPGCPQIHEQVTVVDPWHPDQLLIFSHLASGRGKRLQLWEFGLLNHSDSVTNKPQEAQAAHAKYQFPSVVPLWDE